MDDLEHLLRKRAVPVAVPDDLMARILADATREQPRAPSFALRPAPAPERMTPWQILSDLFGGGGALAGLASAACAGLYLGVAQPAAISTIALAFSGSSAVDQLDFMPSIDSVLAAE
jgi:hypothetical protein